MNKIVIATLLASVAIAGQAAHAQAPADGERTDRQAGRAQMVEQMQEMGLEGFTEHMREQATARFDALDAAGDGVLSLDEFVAAASERAEAMFERMGPNEDGIVTRSAGERGGPRTARGGGTRGMDADQRAERLGERTAEAFARLDTDGDGMISLEEFETGRQARVERFSERRQAGAERTEGRGMRGQGPEHMREMRAMMGDGMNLEQFSTLLETQAAARFDRLDADGNGEISRDEFLASVDERAERAFARMERMESGERPRRGGWHQRRAPAAE